VRWAARHHVQFILVTHMLPYSAEMAGAAAFETSNAGARAVFSEWQARAAAAGVDISAYYDVFMTFRRTPEQAEVMAWSRRMVEDAASRGVSLNLLRLFGSDPALLPRVEAAFAEAAGLARGLGIDLKLPATVPTPERRCEFVEEGSAFVSWDGNVHPCYFLWHRYQCYVGNSEKKVKPQSFGNLRERSLREIWNGADFAAFRGEVVQYDYPFCHDCNAALCSDVRGEEVTDCHLGAVPCAACMWCTGVFQCLQ
jgi:putative metalloenzyme radical SAM/SPASM domain maturase